MVSINFSTSKIITSFILSNRKSNNLFISEIATRISGLALSLFCLIDLAAHTIGVLQSLGDKNRVIKHLKCMQFFASAIPTASFQGLLIPDQKLFSAFEDPRTSSVSALLLSRQEQFFAECSIDPLFFLGYIKEIAAEMPAEDKEHMQETLDLLEAAGEFHKEFNRLNKQTIIDKISFARFLSEKITGLVESDSLFVKHILTRFMALGLSFACALDLLVRIFVITAALIESFIVEFLLFKGKIYHGDLKEMALHFLSHLRDIVLTFPGILASSLTGIIDPSLGAKIGNLTSPFYETVRFTYKDVFKKIISHVVSLEDGKSALIPLSISTGTFDGHILYLLVTKSNSLYSFSVINKGEGMGAALSLLQEPFDSKNSFHLTVDQLTFKEIKNQLDLLVQAATLSSDELQGIYPVIYGLGKEHPHNVVTNTLKGKVQQTGDCSKASLLGALYYHSYTRNKKTAPYKRFLNKIKKLAFEKDGHLLNLAFSLPESPYQFALKKFT